MVLNQFLYFINEWLSQGWKNYTKLHYLSVSNEKSYYLNYIFFIEWSVYYWLIKWHKTIFNVSSI